MTITARIGIVGGNGWLGGAIASAVLASGRLDPARLTISGRADRRGAAETPGVHWTRNNRELTERSDIVILSVRPQDFPDLSIDARGKLVLSVMAGIPVDRIAERTGAVEVVRSIPNAAAAIRRSFTPWYALPAVSAENKALVQALFETCGEAAEVPRESHIDYCVGLTGSGAAFPALLATALIDHALGQGLPRDFAERAARSVVADASQLLRGANGDPSRIVQEMIDYRGTTGAALTTMQDKGFADAVAAGLEAAGTKAAALSSG